MRSWCIPMVTEMDIDLRRLYRCSRCWWSLCFNPQFKQSYSYTNDCRCNHANRHIKKIADDSVILSLLEGEEHHHGPVVDEFTSWCDESFLQLNLSKTKDMIINFRKTLPNPAPTMIKGVGIERVNSYKYLRIVLDSKLSFESLVAVTTKKVQKHLRVLSKIYYFNVSSWDDDYFL